MKRISTCRAAVFAVGSLVLLISGCRSYKAYVRLEPVGRQQIEGGRRVEMNGYSINAPLGKRWGMEIDAERKMVTFFLVKRHSRAGQVLGFTLIQVYRNTVVAPEMLKMKEAEIAEIYRAQELRFMGEEGIPVTDVKKDMVSRDGKTLYSLSYKAPRLRYKNLMIEGVPVISENLLLLYFPPDFKDRHDFYGFLINDAYRPDSLATSTDTEQIYPVIDSLKISPRS
jgi:hypothetical protein